MLKLAMLKVAVLNRTAADADIFFVNMAYRLLGMDRLLSIGSTPSLFAGIIP
ncbi:hypothetical protein QT231_04985 [Halomonas sp. SpR1]|nr:hypothetical protein [Halomonas sp. SpR1]